MELDKQALDRWITTEPERSSSFTEDERDEIISMTDDGEMTELDDGRVLRLRIEPDEGMSFEDFGDCYGSVAPVGSIYDRYGERRSRPEGFTGNAEKIWPPQNSDQYWWEPPKDGPKRGDPGFDQMREQVKDLLAYGMVVIVLELCEGKDHYGRLIVRGSASLGGIEPFPSDEYKAEIIGELLDELDTREE